MFFKLIKHNLKPIFKSILPFIIATFISVVLFNLTSYETKYIYENLPDGKVNLVDIIEPSWIQQNLHNIFNFTTCCSIILLLAFSIRAVATQFRTNFYSDRAYLTHTLPVSRRTLWNAEFCSMVITFASVTIILALNCLLLSITHNGQQLLESFGLIGGCSHCIGDYYFVEPLPLNLYLAYALLIFIELTFITLCSMSGAIIKHRFSKNISLISAVGIYLLGSLILLSLYYVAGDNLFSAFNGYPGTITLGQTFDYGAITRILFYVGFVYVCYCTILYFIDRKLIKRGINLD